MLYALLVAVLCIKSVNILLENFQFNTLEIVDAFDGESNSENEVEEKIEFEDEIIKIFSAYNLTLNRGGKSVLFNEDFKIKNLSRKILIPPPRS